MDTKLRDQIRTVCLSHLRMKGWPRMSKAEIFREVPVMYKQLFDLGLVPRGSGMAFCEAATKAYMSSIV